MVGGGQPPFLTTKIVPARPLGLVARPRLLAFLSELSTKRLGVIKAPAGFGKSSLAAAWAEQLEQNGHSVAWLAVSAVVFGVAFFAVVGSTTAFIRFNYPPAAWPAGIAAMTISFGIGQTLGPIVVGAITDALGSLTYALNVSAATLALGALAAACQRKLKRGQ